MPSFAGILQAELDAGHFSWNFQDRHLRVKEGMFFAQGFHCSTKLSCCSEPIREKAIFDPENWLNLIPNFKPLPPQLIMYTDDKTSVVTTNLKK